MLQLLFEHYKYNYGFYCFDNFCILYRIMLMYM